MIRDSRIWRSILDFGGIILGSALTGLGLRMFLIPNRLAAGGIGGAAIVVNYFTGFRVGSLIFLMNIPLFLLGMKALGLPFGLRTLLGVAVLSLSTDMLALFVPVLTEDLLLAAIYGGVVTGVGMGLVFRSGATTGGTDIVARLLNHFTGISMGQGLFAADFFIIAVAGFVFGVDIALHAIITLFLAGKTIDLVQQGFSPAKAALIISDRADAIREKIINDLERGATLLRGQGGFSREERNIILVVVSRSELSRIKRLVRDLDREAFVIIYEVHEVLGEGFRRIG